MVAHHIKASEHQSKSKPGEDPSTQEASDPSSAKRITLLGLPIEVRRMIWELTKPPATVVSGYRTVNTRVEQDGSLTTLRPKEPFFKAWPVILLNHQIYSEFGAGLQRQNVVAVFHNIGHLKYFVERLSIQQLGLVTTYEVSILNSNPKITLSKRHFETSIMKYYKYVTVVLGKPQGIYRDKVSVAMNIKHSDSWQCTWSSKAIVATATVYLPHLRNDTLLIASQWFFP